MGWQTDVLTQIVFNKENYNSVYEVENSIDEENTLITNLKEDLLALAVSRPSDWLINNEDMDLSSLKNDAKGKLELLEECIIKVYELECLKKNFDLRDGDFINNKKVRHNIKQWLIDNYILKKEDLNMDINDEENDDEQSK